MVKKLKRITKKVDLSKQLAIEMKKHPQMTVDEFYDKYGVPKEARTDFGTGALLKQAEKYREGQVK